MPVALGAASYVASLNTVTLATAGRLKPGSYQLVITSSPSGGVRDASGQPLVGGNATIALRA